MPRTVLQRLRRIDLKLANRVSRRRIGSLIGRLYFQPAGSPTWTEVPIIAFEDRGISPKNLRTGEEITAARYGVQVGRDWWDVNRAISGRYGIRPGGTQTELLIEVDVEGHVANDGETTVSLDLRIATQLDIYG